MTKQNQPKSVLYYPIATVASVNPEEVFRVTQGIDSLSKDELAKVLSLRLEFCTFVAFM